MTNIGTNNARFYLPGGMYRQQYESPETYGLTPKDLEIRGDIIDLYDRAMEETGFDMDKYQELEERHEEIDEKALRILCDHGRNEEFEELVKKQTEISKEMENMLLPLVGYVEEISEYDRWELVT